LENGANDDDSMDLFRAGLNDHFDDISSPASKWWDGTTSGLKINGISGEGATVSFKD
jgi:hypothetical protein